MNLQKIGFGRIVVTGERPQQTICAACAYNGPAFIQRYGEWALNPYADVFSILGGFIIAHTKDCPSLEQ